MIFLIFFIFKDFFHYRIILYNNTDQACHVVGEIFEDYAFVQANSNHKVDLRSRCFRLVADNSTT